MPISKQIIREQNSNYQTQQPRDASIEVKADLNTSSMRPQSSSEKERGRKKKKKKTKHKADISDCASSVTNIELKKKNSDLNTY